MSSRAVFFICLMISFLSIIFYFLSFLNTIPFPYIINKTTKILSSNSEPGGFISSSLYNELNSYITTRNKNIHYIKKSFVITNGEAINVPLNYNYIKFIKNDRSKSYPYSTWKCSNTSNANQKQNSEYCILTNIYYQSSTDQYYFFRNPSAINTEMQRDTFTTSSSALKLRVTDDITIIKSLNYLSNFIQPVLITHPPDQNYAHGFLESCGPRFWTLAECQYHPSYVDPSKIQIYYTSDMFERFPGNWNNYQQQSDGTYRPKRKWEYMIQSMFSRYPLLTYKSFNQTTVLFNYLLFTGVLNGRTSIWAHHYQERPVNAYPYPTVNYRRAYLAYSEWILNNFNLKSKFELTSIQEELQQKKISEKVPICPERCNIIQEKKNLSNDFTGEWIVVMNRAGVGRRELTNANELVAALLKTFPDNSNPYLRVWPKQFNFNDNLYQVARMARSIRILIGVHGAGLSNSLFMRPGTILYEINPYNCRHLSFNFHRWAEVFNLQHALWIPSTGANGNHNENCNREGRTTVNTKEIIDEVKNLLQNEIEYRNGYLKRALMIMNDMSVVDHPPSGFEKIL